MKELPRGWARCALEGVAELITKGTTPTSIGFPFVDHGVPFIKVENIRNRRIDRESISAFISSEIHEALARSQLREHDILFSIAGTIGKTALASASDVPGNTNQAVAIVRVSKDLMDARFVRGQLESGLSDALNHKARGGAMSNVSLSDLRAHEMVIAPIREQREIGGKLDAILVTVDGCRARLQRVPQILKRFREAVLEAAVTGKLTEEWRRSAVVDDTWQDAAVGDFVTAVNGRAFPSADYSDQGIRLLRPGNMHASGYVVWTDKNTAFLPVEYAEQFPSFLLGEDELLMNLTAQSLKDNFLGRVCLKRDSAPALLNQRICAYRPTSKGDIRPFLHVYFRSPTFRRYVDTLDSGTLIKHMYSKQVLTHRLRIPSKREQAEIVRRVDDLFRLADSIEQQYEAAAERVDRIPASVLAKAFSGELVPQDPADEPASVLLERVREGREGRASDKNITQSRVVGGVGASNRLPKAQKKANRTESVGRSRFRPARRV